MVAKKDPKESLEKEQILFVIGVIETTCKSLLALIPFLKGMLKP